jgi:hypothetical protein
MSSRLQTCSGFEHVDVNCRCQLGWSFAAKALSLQHFRLLNLREAEWSLPRFHVWNRCGSNLTFGRGSLWGKLPDLHQPQHGSKDIAANANKPTMPYAHTTATFWKPFLLSLIMNRHRSIPFIEPCPWRRFSAGLVCRARGWSSCFWRPSDKRVKIGGLHPMGYDWDR